MYSKMREYNGYTNKPTWLISLWIDNNQNELEYILQHAEEYSEEYESYHEFSDWLKDTVEEWQSDTVRMNNMFSDLLNFALAYVNWDELSQGYIQEARENIGLINKDN